MACVVRDKMVEGTRRGDNSKTVVDRTLLTTTIKKGSENEIEKERSQKKGRVQSDVVTTRGKSFKR